MNVLNTTTLLAAIDPAYEEAAEEAAGGISDLGLDPLQIALQAGTFVVLFYLVRKFAFKKIVSILDERHDTIEEGIANAQKASQQLDESAEATKEAMKKARKEAEVIIAKAHEETGLMVKEAEITASKNADRIVADAQNKIGADVLKAKKELKTELAGLVAEATEAVISEKMNSDTDKKLIERMLKQ